MRAQIPRAKKDVSLFVNAINLGSHFLRGAQPYPVSKLKLKQRVRGLTASTLIGSRTSERAKVRALNQRLGIDACYGAKHQLALQREAKLLTLCGLDGLRREFWLAPQAALAWRALKAAALADGVRLVEISGFRSVEYQAGLILGKLRRGQTIAEILKVSAAPGFSEHHTGRAVDVCDSDELANRSFLTEAFELTESYAWLVQNASRYGFTQSFGRDNRRGIAYEPWHWCFRQRTL
jgi:zinc D-Ala-D-Ala carboxypeptidase